MATGRPEPRLTFSALRTSVRQDENSWVVYAPIDTALPNACERRSLQAISEKLRQAHALVPWAKRPAGWHRVVRGWLNYHAVPGNQPYRLEVNSLTKYTSLWLPRAATTQ